MNDTIRDVVFVDGVRTPFGKAGKLFEETRADDMIIRCIRSLLRRNPGLPPERVDEVALAATTQIGDQGLTLGRTAAILAGLPRSVPGYSIDRMCAGAMTAVTSVSSAIAARQYDIAIAGGVESMSNHPMGEGVDPNPRIIAERLVDPEALKWATRPRTCTTCTRTSPRRAPTPTPWAPSSATPPPSTALGRHHHDGRPLDRRGLDHRHRRRAAATRDHARRPRVPADPVPPARPRHRRHLRAAHRRRHRVPAGRRRDRRRTGPARRHEDGRLRLRRRRPRDHGLGPDPGHREGPLPRRTSRSRTSACSRSTRPSPSRSWRSSTTSRSPTTTRA